MFQAVINRTPVFMYNFRYFFFRIVTNYGFSGRILMNVCPEEPR